MPQRTESAHYKGQSKVLTMGT